MSGLCRCGSVQRCDDGDKLISVTRVITLQHNHRSWLFDSLTALRAGRVLSSVFIDAGKVPGTSRDLLEDRDNILA